jgi:hypothetical protein
MPMGTRPWVDSLASAVAKGDRRENVMAKSAQYDAVRLRFFLSFYIIIRLRYSYRYDDRFDSPGNSELERPCEAR